MRGSPTTSGRLNSAPLLAVKVSGIWPYMLALSLLSGLVRDGGAPAAIGSPSAYRTDSRSAGFSTYAAGFGKCQEWRTVRAGGAGQTRCGMTKTVAHRLAASPSCWCVGNYKFIIVSVARRPASRLSKKRARHRVAIASVVVMTAVKLAVFAFTA